MFVCRLGPLDFDESPVAYAYLALLDNGLMLAPVIHSDARIALESFVGKAGGEPLLCEGRLRYVAEPLGFEAAPTPLEVLAARAAIALTLAQGQLGVTAIPDPPWLLNAHLQAYALYLARRPFDFFSDKEPFEVSILSNGRKKSKVAVLMGNAGQEFGVAVYPDYKTFLRVSSGTRPERVTSMALVLHADPPYASSAIDEAYGFKGVPIIVSTGRKPSEEDRLVLSSILRAAAMLTDSAPHSTVEGRFESIDLSVSLSLASRG